MSQNFWLARLFSGARFVERTEGRSECRRNWDNGNRYFGQAGHVFNLHFGVFKDGARSCAKNSDII